MSTIIKGDELQLFYNGNTFAYATSHTLTITGNTVDVATKDHGYWGASSVGNITWEISSENLDTTADYDTLFELMVSQTKLPVQFGLVGNYNPNGLQSVGGPVAAWTLSNKYYSGSVYITSLTLNANTGENATYSVTFTGSGPLIADGVPSKNYVQTPISLEVDDVILTDANSGYKFYDANGKRLQTTMHQDSVVYTGRGHQGDIYIKAPSNTFDASVGGMFDRDLYIDIPNIGAGTFVGWGGTEITFGPSVANIGDGAFDREDAGLDPMNLIFLGTTPPVFGRDICGNIANVYSVTVPNGCLQAYQTAWDGYGTVVWIEADE